MDEERLLWIFGYGSICWNPGFEFKKSMIGYVRGFARRFWQGNTTHRGTVDKPGRVATLINSKDEITFGRAFEVTEQAALPYLDHRECKLGGYFIKTSTFYSRNGKKQFPVLIYIANDENQHWLGDAPLTDIAKNILECQGPSGHNVEYLLRLADFMHRFIPEAIDNHLFTLESIVNDDIKKHNLCLKTLMGDKDFTNFEVVDSTDEEDNQQPGPSYSFLSRIPSKNLRCTKP